MDEKQIHVLLVEDNPGDARLMLEYASQAGGTAFAIEWADRLGKALEILANQDIDVIVLDLGLPDSRGLETFTRLQAAAARVPVIVLSGMDDEALGIEAVRRGAQDYLVKGTVNGQLLVRAMRYAMERQKMRAAARPETAARVLAFLGAKGGVGTTSVALNVASALACQGNSVVLAELWPYPGTLARQVRMAPAASLAGLLQLEPEKIDQPELAARLAKLPSGLRVLFGPQTSEESAELSPSRAQAILQALGPQAAFVVLDLAPQPSAGNRAALQAADFTALVLEPEELSIACAKTSLQVLAGWGLSRRNTGAVIVNRGLVSASPLTELKTRLGWPIVGMIPPAGEAFAAAGKAAVPLVLSKPDCNAAVALAELATRLAQDPVPALGS